MDRCIIFAAGSYYGMPIEVRQGDLVIAADAGCLICQKESIQPDLLIGDFDSLPENTLDVPVIRYPVEKDDTDTMLAIRKGFEYSADEFHIIGGTGGQRSDHTLANIQALAYIASHGGRGFLYDRNAVYTVIIDSSISIRKTVEWGLLSLFSMSTECRGVSIKGAQYPLESGTLRMDFPLGVSNHITDDEAYVEVKDGCLLVCWEIPDSCGK